jgi:hypothetical protein
MNPATTSVENPLCAVREKGGRPVGTTDAAKKHCENAVLATKKEVAGLYERAKKQAGKKRLPPGYLRGIIREVTKRNLLPEDVVSEACIRQRRKKQKLFVQTNHPGTLSPLHKYEMHFVKTMIMMGRIRQSLRPSQSVELINSMISGTRAQEDLVAWKKKHSYGEDGTVGIGYWQAFLNRNSHLICSKRGQKYELDRDKWTTYANFSQMYEHVYEYMEEAGVAVKLEAPVWRDKAGHDCTEEDAFGCNVTHDLTHHEMCVVMDEVGGNTSQKGDGHIGGELLVCEKGATPQKQ